jgi:hypothetical protein
MKPIRVTLALALVAAFSLVARPALANYATINQPSCSSGSATNADNGSGYKYAQTDTYGCYSVSASVGNFGASGTNYALASGYTTANATWHDYSGPGGYNWTFLQI